MEIMFLARRGRFFIFTAAPKTMLFHFFEALGDDSVYAESLTKRGDGVNDLVFSVSSVDTEIAKLESKGVLLHGRSEDGRSVFFDTRAEGNIMVRLVQ